MTHYPNFNGLRLLAASAVVFSHAFLLATGSEETEPLQSTGMTAGVYGVFVFFILSGFLVTESAKRSSGVLDYCRKRFLRIAPAFVVSTILITYAVVPFFAPNGPTAFIQAPEVLSKVIATIFLQDDGLYFYGVEFYPPSGPADFLPSVANGVLWTIRLEIIGYALVGLFMALSLLQDHRQPVTILFVVAIAALSLVYANAVSVKWISELLLILPAFCCGIFLNWMVRFHTPRGRIALLFVAGIAPAVYFGVLPQVFTFLVAYPLIWLGAVQFKPLAWFSSGSDISYGLYLFGWPVTQLIRSFMGEGLSGYEMTASALPVTALIAYASWHLIEKPALRFKTVVRRKAVATSTAQTPSVPSSSTATVIRA
jgi:peptidoglycan/LPS O-acetylase OafA/YrhL